MSDPNGKERTRAWREKLSASQKERIREKDRAYRADQREQDADAGAGTGPFNPASNPLEFLAHARTLGAKFQDRLDSRKNQWSSRCAVCGHVVLGRELIASGDPVWRNAAKLAPLKVEKYFVLHPYGVRRLTVPGQAEGSVREWNSHDRDARVMELWSERERGFPVGSFTALELWMCKLCDSGLASGRLTKFTLSQAPFPTLSVPPELAGLTLIEKRMICAVRSFLSISRCPVANFYGSYQSKGNVVHFLQDVAAIAEQLPPNMDIVVEDFFVLQPRRHDDGHVELKSLTVRREKVRSALLYLKQHRSDIYASIPISDENLAKLPESGVPPEISERLTRRRKQPDTDARAGESSSDDDSDDADMGDPRRTGDPMPVTSVFSDADGVNLPSAVMRVLGRVEIKVPPATVLASEYDTIGLLTCSLPHLFPDGKECLNSPAASGLTPRQYFRHLLAFHGRFQADPLFLFLGLNVIQRREQGQSTATVVKSHATEAQKTALDLVLSTTFAMGQPRRREAHTPARQSDVPTHTGADAELAAADMSPAQVVNHCKNVLTRCTKTRPGSQAYKRQGFLDAQSLLLQQGWPQLFVTLSSADDHWSETYRLASLRAKLDAGVLLAPGDFTTSAAGTLWGARQKVLIDNPVDVALAFVTRFDAALATLICPGSGVPRAFGVVEDYFFEFEVQLRGSLHAHGLLFVRDAPCAVDVLDHFDLSGPTAGSQNFARDRDERRSGSKSERRSQSKNESDSDSNSDSESESDSCNGMGPPHLVDSDSESESESEGPPHLVDSDSESESESESERESESDTASDGLGAREIESDQENNVFATDGDVVPDIIQCGCAPSAEALKPDASESGSGRSCHTIQNLLDFADSVLTAVPPAAGTDFVPSPRFAHDHVCTVPFSPMRSDAHLLRDVGRIMLTVQAHVCGKWCLVTRRKKRVCRYGFHQDLRRDQTGVVFRNGRLTLAPRRDRENINPCNPYVALIWRANSDAQCLLNPYAAVVYVCKYVFKGESTASTLHAVLAEALRTLERRYPGIVLPPEAKLRRLANAATCARQISQQEAACLIMGYALRARSFTVEPLFPQPGLVLVETREGGLPRSPSSKLWIDYAHRPKALERLSAFRLFSQYAKTKKTLEGILMPLLSSHPQWKTHCFSLRGTSSSKAKRLVVDAKLGPQFDEQSEVYCRNALTLFSSWRPRVRAVSIAHTGSLLSTTAIAPEESACEAFTRWLADAREHENHLALAQFERFRQRMKFNLSAARRIHSRFASHSDAAPSADARAAPPSEPSANGAAGSSLSDPANDYSLLEGHAEVDLDARAPTRAELDAQVCVQICFESGLIDRLVSTAHLQLPHSRSFRIVSARGERKTIAASVKLLAAAAQPAMSFRAEFNHLYDDQRDVLALVENDLCARCSAADANTVPPPPLVLHVDGEAGTGKTRVIQVIQAMFSHYSRSSWLLTTATTGVAASLSSGYTLHYALSLPIDHDFNRRKNSDPAAGAVFPGAHCGRGRGNFAAERHAVFARNFA